MIFLDRRMIEAWQLDAAHGEQPAVPHEKAYGFLPIFFLKYWRIIIGIPALFLYFYPLGCHYLPLRLEDSKRKEKCMSNNDETCGLSNKKKKMM